MSKITNENSFQFWQKWLLYTSIVFAIAGIVFALFGNNILFAKYNTMLAEVFWHQSEFPPEADRFRAFIYAPLGGTIACCYILLAFIAYHPFKNKQLWARNAILVAFAFWVVIDTALCIHFEVYPQIYLINALSAAVKALPIICTWKHFTSHKKPGN
jgi:hypothetical protein